ncbi:MAG: L,D-transpeptidase family protein [Epsilonproteobacteria bacterium]|nr:L,D-transpeptidase family protein [Campylobacterota bacterium]
MKKVVLLFLVSLFFLKADIIDIVNRSNSSYKSLLKELYLLNNKELFWVDKPSLYSSLIRVLNMDRYNYLHKNLNRTLITQYAFKRDTKGLNRLEREYFDLILSDAFLRLLHFVRVGDVDWNLVKQKMKILKKEQDIHAIWELTPKKMPLAKDIYPHLKRGDLQRYLESQIGQRRRYNKLIALLKRYEEMPPFRKIKNGRILKYKDRSRRIYEIKRRLRLFGDFPQSGSINRNFDRDLAFALARFKKRMNLAPGAFIDNRVIYYLNLPKEEYIKTIIVNLAKTKLYPPYFEKEYVEVNIPEFMLRYYKNGKVIFKSEIVAGMIERPTPIFSDFLEYVVLNPTWTIPPTVLKKDFFPALKEDPSIIKSSKLHFFRGSKEVFPSVSKILSYENKIESFPYRIVQAPGADNALGKMKFMFPNKYSVYLHDTPHKKAFAYRYRLYSSGCMRVASPREFLESLRPVLVSNPSSATLDRILSTNKMVRFNLKRKIPIHIVYFTIAWEYGSPRFLYDVYLYDKMIWESMAGHKKSTFVVPQKRLEKSRYGN